MLAKAFNLVSAFYTFYENPTKEMNKEFLREMFSLTIFNICFSKCDFAISLKNLYQKIHFKILITVIFIGNMKQIKMKLGNISEQK